MAVSILSYQGLAGDRNPHAMSGSRTLAHALSAYFDTPLSVIGHPETPLAANWDAELGHALPQLKKMQHAIEHVFHRNQVPLAAISRCATALATIPIVTRVRPDACVVWFDAHADLNTPAASDSGYLGGLALSGPLGLWNSGLGAGLPLENVVLVGQRDIDPFEADLIASKSIPWVKPGPEFTAALCSAVGDRPVYVHIDCDVMDPGIVPTEYRCEGGLSLDDLAGASEVLANNEIIGMEISELQITDGNPKETAAVSAFVAALSPLLDTLKHG